MKKKFMFVTLAVALATAVSAVAAGCKDTNNTSVEWNGVDAVSLARGDRFDPLAGVEVIDPKDGDITESVILKEDDNLDTEYPGRYTLEYEAMNNSGKVYTMTREVSVSVAHNVANGQFDRTTRSWTFDVPGGNGNAQIKNEEQHITITNSGNQWWSIQFYQLNLYLTKNVTYKLSFDAKSPQGHSISAGFEEVNNNNRMMQRGVKVMKLNEEYQKYELTYKSDADVMNAKAVIYLGWQLPGDEASVENPHEVVIDNVYVEKVETDADAPKFEGVEGVQLVSGNHTFDAKSGVTCKDASGASIDYTVSGVIPAYVQKGCYYLVQYDAVDSAGRKTSVLREVEFILAAAHPYETFNGDFSQGFVGWTPEINQVMGTGKAEYTEDKENGTVSIKVLDPSEADFHIQLYQDRLKFTKGETYRIKVIAKASAARKIKIEVTDALGDYANIAEPIIADLTTEFATFTLEFTAEKDYRNVKVAALLGNLGGTAADITVTFDAFIIEKVV